MFAFLRVELLQKLNENNKMGFRINLASEIKKNTNLPVRTSGI